MSFFTQLKLVYELLLFVSWSVSYSKSRLKCATYYFNSMHCCAYAFFSLFLFCRMWMHQVKDWKTEMNQTTNILLEQLGNNGVYMIEIDHQIFYRCRSTFWMSCYLCSTLKTSFCYLDLFRVN